MVQSHFHNIKIIVILVLIIRIHSIMGFLHIEEVNIKREAEGDSVLLNIVEQRVRIIERPFPQGDANVMEHNP